MPLFSLFPRTECPEVENLISLFVKRTYAPELHNVAPKCMLQRVCWTGVSWRTLVHFGLVIFAERGSWEPFSLEVHGEEPSWNQQMKDVHLAQ